VSALSAAATGDRTWCAISRGIHIVKSKRCATRVRAGNAVGAEYRIPMVTDHPAELFANPDLDLIVVATPSFSHYPLAKAALEAGSTCW